MPNIPVKKIILPLYDLLWKVAIPVLRKNNRLADGFAERILERPHLMKADLWIQSASAGEAYLAWELLKQISDDEGLRILLTTNTLQGMEILHKVTSDREITSKKLEIRTAYFPFDRPTIIQKAVHLIQPRAMVLLETELWPGLLSRLKTFGCRVLIINGRLTAKSLSRYLVWPSLWYQLRPDRILAISDEDAHRFSRLFGNKTVSVMSNIKFDRLDSGDHALADENVLQTFLPPRNNFMVLGSVRQEEENGVAKIISEVHQRRSEAVIGLFPRHLHRIAHWQKILQRMGIPWRLRSAPETQTLSGSVILWDVFGELGLAYKQAAAAFVGGSLAPLGGQNFLEPLISGVTPVIGPFWDNFKWVGKEIIDSGMVRQAVSWKEVAEILIASIMNPQPQEMVRQQAKAYIKNRQGGTAKACEVIEDYLKREYRISNKE
jgi:3-deoxy-D-manno-octulosonic-acid transferase